jgi:hypothetical protein
MVHYVDNDSRPYDSPCDQRVCECRYSGPIGSTPTRTSARVRQRPSVSGARKLVRYGALGAPSWSANAQGWEPTGDASTTRPPPPGGSERGSRFKCGCAPMDRSWSACGVLVERLWCADGAVRRSTADDACIHRATRVFAALMLAIGLAETEIVERSARRWCGNGALRRKRRCGDAIHRATSTFASAVIRGQSGRRQGCRP